MINITDKTKCSGCTACASACPRKCIAMQPDHEGFLYPVVNIQQCIDCGLCNRVCPIENPMAVKEQKLETYAVRSKDKTVLKNSTSGGMFTALASWILEKDGVICAAAYDETFAVIHQFIDSQETWSMEDFKKFRGSKYVQSDVRGCYPKIKEFLSKGRNVCFIGTPCQVGGLKSFLQKEYPNLLTVDLVCHGTPSPKLWKKYLDYQMEKHRSEIKTVSFRSKVFGYHSGGFMEIHFANGKSYLASGRSDYMTKVYFDGLSPRPSCFQCAFKQRNRCSDLTIYDCQAYSALTGQQDDDLGYTNVLVHSPAGKQALMELDKYVTAVSVDTDHAIKRNGIMMEHLPRQHPDRDKFFKDLDQHSLPEHIRLFCPSIGTDRVIDWTKKQMYQLPVLRKLRKLAKKIRKGRH